MNGQSGQFKMMALATSGMPDLHNSMIREERERRCVHAGEKAGTERERHLVEDCDRVDERYERERERERCSKTERPADPSLTPHAHHQKADLTTAVFRP